MLLAIDIGNTNMEFGIFDGERLAGSFRLGTNRDITSDEVGLFTSQFSRENGFDRREIEDVVSAHRRGDGGAKMSVHFRIKIPSFRHSYKGAAEKGEAPYRFVS